MHTPAEIFDAACTIRPELPRLLGSQSKAEALDQQLAALLNQDRSTPGLENQITILLAQEEATRKWMADILTKDIVERSFQPAPNDSSNLIKLPKFICPHGDYIWYRHNVGEPIPPCPTHEIPLERVNE